jgi:hypothetical protein
LAHDAGRVALRRADRPVMQIDGRQRLARTETEIADDEIAVDRCGEIRGSDYRREDERCHANGGRQDKNLHSGAP